MYCLWKTSRQNFVICKILYQLKDTLKSLGSKIHEIYTYLSSKKLFFSLTVKFGYSEKANFFEKNLPLKIWCYSVTSNFKWKVFSNFVAFSEFLNFWYIYIFRTYFVTILWALSFKFSIGQIIQFTFIFLITLFWWTLHIFSSPQQILSKVLIDNGSSF